MLFHPFSASPSPFLSRSLFLSISVSYELFLEAIFRKLKIIYIIRMDEMFDNRQGNNRERGREFLRQIFPWAILYWTKVKFIAENYFIITLSMIANNEQNTSYKFSYDENSVSGQRNCSWVANEWVVFRKWSFHLGF